MNESTIGIKIANGSYFPILEEDSNKRKRLVLTTVNDNQENVQIDLYRGAGKSLEDATYIGSLQIDNIEPAEKGVPEIELFLGLDEEGNLDAKASDAVTGESQSLSLSLDSLDEEHTYDEPDFEIDQSMDTEDLMTPEEESKLTSGPPEATIASSYEVPQKKKNPLMIILFVVLGLAIIGALIILGINLFGKGGSGTDDMEADNNVTSVADVDARSSSGSDTSAAAQETVVPADPADSETAETVQSQETAETAAAPAAETAAAETQADESTAAASGGPGTDYLIRKGDTLWDISERFYGDPWKYPSIAKENDIIKDPDLIYWGFRITIPGKP